MQQLIERLKRDGADDETINAFLKYHEQNPMIWRHFSKYAAKAMASGKQIGAKAVAERVRWECEIETHGEFKVSNSWIPYYARAFNVEAKREFFSCKELHGVKVYA